MDHSIATIRMIKTNSTYFNSDEDTKKCCVYDFVPILVDKTYILRLPYSYGLPEDLSKQIYYMEVSIFYFYNIGNFIILLCSMLYLKMQYSKYSIQLFAIALLFLFINIVIWNTGY